MASTVLCRYTQAHWLRSAFTESYRLLRLTLPKELVDAYVWNAPDQWHHWRVAGVRTAPPPAKRNVKTGPLPSLYFGICYSFDFSRLFFLCFSDCFPVISGFRIAVQYRICHCFSTIFWVLASGLLSAKLLPGSNLTASDQSLRLYCR